MTFARNHHYVPQHITKSFADDRKQVFCYNKRTGNSYRTHTKNVFVERDFHTIDVEIDGKEFRASFEEALTRAEATYQPALEKVLKTKNLLNLSEDEQLHLCVMVAFQFLRSKSFREGFERVSEDLRTQIKEKFPNADLPEELTPLDDAQTKLMQLKFLREGLPDLAKSLFEDKYMFFYKAPKDEPFIVGDNPSV